MPFHTTFDVQGSTSTFDDKGCVSLVCIKDLERAVVAIGTFFILVDFVTISHHAIGLLDPCHDQQIFSQV